MMAFCIDVSSTSGTACATSCSCDSTATPYLPCFLPFPLLDQYRDYRCFGPCFTDISTWRGREVVATTSNVRSNSLVCPGNSGKSSEDRSDFVLRIQAIGNEHVPGAVGDHQGRSGLLSCSLGRHAAGPEHGCLIF